MKRFLFMLTVTLLGWIGQAQASAWLGPRSVGHYSSPLLTASVSGEDEPRTGKARFAHDSPWTIDKFIHFMWSGYMTRKFTYMTKSKVKGFGLSTLAGGGNEIKDMFLPWEKWGPIGGDGGSGWDMGANLAGNVYAVIFPGAIPEETDGAYCQWPMDELVDWTTGTFALIGIWSGGWMVYNVIHDHKPFPHGTGHWREETSTETKITHVISNFYAEPYIMGPIFVNSLLKPYMGLGYRGIAMTGSVGLYALAQAYVRDEDIPFVGAPGLNRTGAAFGLVTIGVVLTYDAIVYPKEVNSCKPYFRTELTPRGVAFQRIVKSQSFSLIIGDVQGRAFGLNFMVQWLP